MGVSKSIPLSFPPSIEHSLGCIEISRMILDLFVILLFVQSFQCNRLVVQHLT